MTDLAFYNVDGARPSGFRRLAVVPRRVLRRLLRPIFARQVELFREIYHRLYVNELAVHELHGHHDLLRRDLSHSFHWGLEDISARLSRRQDELDAKLQTLMAIGWDHVAMTRRLAALEDQIAILSGTPQASADEGEPHPSIYFPGLDLAADRDDDDSMDGPESLARVG